MALCKISFNVYRNFPTKLLVPLIGFIKNCVSDLWDKKEVTGRGGL
jgi:hypothetical protein